MVQTIYLTRHWQILDNVMDLLLSKEEEAVMPAVRTFGDLEQYLISLDKTLDMLNCLAGECYQQNDSFPLLTTETARGIKQAKQLGEYLKTKHIDSSNTVFLTSSLPRTKKTGKLVAKILDFPWIEDETFHVRSELDEFSNPDYSAIIKDPEGAKRMTRDVLRSHAERTFQTIKEFTEYVGEKNVVVVGHLNRNRALLNNYFPYLVGGQLNVANCSMHELAIDGDTLVFAGECLIDYYDNELEIMSKDYWMPSWDYCAE